MKKIIFITLLMASGLSAQSWFSATMDSNSTTSSAFKLGYLRPTALIINGGFKGSQVTLTGAYTDGGTYYAVVDTSGNPITYKVVKNKYLLLGQYDLRGLTNFKVVSDSTQTSKDVVIRVKGDLITGEKK